MAEMHKLGLTAVSWGIQNVSLSRNKGSFLTVLLWSEIYLSISSL